MVKQPQNSSGKDGEQVTLSIEVTGGTAPNYFDWQSYSQGEWQSLYNSSDTSIYRGNTESMITLRIGNDWTTNEPFRCVVTDAHGQVGTSNTVQITLINVTSPLKIVSQPVSKTGTEGTWVSFTVVVTGGKEPYTYRWESTQGDYDFIGGIGCATVNGETTATLWVQIKKGYYPEGEDLRCVITDADGNKVISNVVTATLSGGSGGSGGLLITKQPSDHWMNSSMEEVTFTITVEGGMPPYTFDWYYGRPGGYSKFDSVFTNMDSATGKEMFSDYDFEDLQTSDIDIYCVVTDDWGATVTSKICHIYQY
jgi:hypothetical protein